MQNQDEDSGLTWLAAAFQAYIICAQEEGYT